MRDLDQLRRKVKALVAATIAGAVILGLLQYAILPRIARQVTMPQSIWLRDAFRSHAGWFLLAIVALAAIISIPVLLVAAWAVRRRA